VYIGAHHDQENHIGNVMVSVLASSVIDRQFQSLSCQNKDYKIGICYFFP